MSQAVIEDKENVGNGGEMRGKGRVVGLVDQLQEVQIGKSLFDDLPHSKDHIEEDEKWERSGNVISGWTNSNKTIESFAVDSSEQSEKQVQLPLENYNQRNYKEGNQEYYKQEVEQQEQENQDHEQIEINQIKLKEQEQGRNQEDVKDQEKQDIEIEREMQFPLQEKQQQQILINQKAEENQQDQQQQQFQQSKVQSNKQQQNKQKIEMALENNEVVQGFQQKNKQIFEQQDKEQQLFSILETNLQQLIEVIQKNVSFQEKQNQSKKIQCLQKEIQAVQSNQKRSLQNKSQNEILSLKYQQVQKNETAQVQLSKKIDQIIILAQKQQQQITPWKEQFLVEMNIIQKNNQIIVKDTFIQQSQEQPFNQDQTLANATKMEQKLNFSINQKSQQNSQSEMAYLFKDESQIVLSQIINNKETQLLKIQADHLQEKPTGSKQSISQNISEGLSLIQNAFSDDSQVEVHEIHELHGNHVEVNERDEDQSEYLQTIKQFTNQSAHSLGQEREDFEKNNALIIEGHKQFSQTIMPLQQITEAIEEVQEIQEETKINLRSKFKGIILYKLYQRLASKIQMRVYLQKWYQIVHKIEKNQKLSEQHQDKENNIQQINDQEFEVVIPQKENEFRINTQKTIIDQCEQKEQEKKKISQNIQQISSNKNVEKEQVIVEKIQNQQDKQNRKKNKTQQQTSNQKQKQLQKVANLDQTGKDQNLKQILQQKDNNKQIISKIISELKKDLQGKNIQKSKKVYKKGERWSLDPKQVARMKRIDSKVYRLEERIQLLYLGVNEHLLLNF